MGAGRAGVGPHGVRGRCERGVAGGGERGARFVASRMALALVALGLASAQLIAGPAASAAVNDPVSCGRVYALDQSGETRRLYSVDTGTGAMSTNNTFTVASGSHTNALAVDADHDRFWFAEQAGGQTSTVVHRYDPMTGADLTIPMTLTGVPTTSGGLVMGAYSPATQIYYLGLVVDDGTARTLWIYGLDTLTNTPVSGVVARVSLGSGANGDFAFDQAGRLYIVSDGVLLALDEPLPTTGTADGPLLTTTAIADPPGGQNHSMAFGGDGYLYLGSLVGDSRVVYRVDPSTGAVLADHQLLPDGNTVSDFASCASPNSITLRKTVPDGRLAGGDQFDLAITGGGLSQGNTGVTTGAETGLQDQDASEVAGPVLGLAGTQYTITEAAAGTTSFEDYATTYTCVDRISGSTVASGSTTSGTVTMPDNGSLGADVVCTFSNTALRPDISVTKTVDPQDGTTVTAGQVLTYTLTFTNAGLGSGSVAYDDVVAGVLDDATVTAQPSSSSGALTASAISGGRFGVSGSLAAGQTATVTYAVTVKGEGERGDNLLDNVVVPTGQDPPDECAQDDPLCTRNPVPQIGVTKSVDPADGSTVTAGQELTYTLTFANAGRGAGAVAYDDVVAGVLDDATVTAGPVASSGALTASAISDGRFSVTGTLAAGQTVTVSYTVTVKPDGERGDHLLANVVVPAGQDPAGGCREGDPLCTENPVPEIGVAKSVDPADGSTVTAGQDLTYTLTFSNTGQAAGAVELDDVISGVLDDATVTGHPTASDDALTVSDITDGRFSVTGTLAAGDTVTVGYTVTVKADGDRGDDLLANFLVATGEDPAGECLEGDPLCTENPVSRQTPQASPVPRLPLTGASTFSLLALAVTAVLGGAGLYAARRRVRRDEAPAA